MIGQINKIFPNKGFGFIKTEEGEEFFFHMSALRGTEWDTLVGICKLGEPHVYFKEQKHLRGPRAINVELVPNID
jgi:cold shock CspA family protein